MSVPGRGLDVMRWARTQKDADGLPLFTPSQLDQLLIAYDPFRYVYNVGYSHGMYDCMPVLLDGPAKGDRFAGPAGEGL